METKLKLVFQNPKLRLAVKTLVFAFLLGTLSSGRLGFFPILFFGICAGFLYAIPFFRTFELGGPFILLLAEVIMTVQTFSSGIVPMLYFAVLFYLILGIKDLALVDRESWQRVLVLLLSYPLFIMFFYYPGTSEFLRLFGIFIGFVILMKQVIVHRAARWLVSFLGLQIAWAISLLPIGFLSQSGLAALSWILLADIAYYHQEHKLTKRTVLIHGTLLTTLTLLVFVFSRWGV